MSDDQKIPNPLFVKKKESKQGETWHKLANQRINKQHHGGEIPEGDRHFIPKFASLEHTPTPPSPEETEAKLTDLEKQVKELQEKDKQLPPPPPQVTPPTTAPAKPAEEDDWYD